MKNFENYRRLHDLQCKMSNQLIDTCQNNNFLQEFKEFDITKKKLVMDGELVWKYKKPGGGAQRSHTMHGVLLDDLFVLLLKQEDRLVLKCHETYVEDASYTYYPILKLPQVLTKEVGRNKCEMFVINRDPPQVYQLEARSKEARNRWVGRWVVKRWVSEW